MLTAEEKEKIIKKYQLHSLDTGSAPVQIALLTEQIKKLVLHLKTHPKDFHSKRGLLKLVGKRRKLLRWLKEEDPKTYSQLVEQLKLKA
jgi:small subunit ribosomal protein S15